MGYSKKRAKLQDKYPDRPELSTSKVLYENNTLESTYKFRGILIEYPKNLISGKSFIGVRAKKIKDLIESKV